MKKVHSPAPPRREASSSATLFPGTADVNRQVPEWKAVEIKYTRRK